MKKLFLILAFFSVFYTCAQVGGEKVYSFLNLPSSAHQSALGGAANTIEGDVNMPMWNPAMLDASMRNKFAVNYTSYLAGISFGSVSYATQINKKIGMFYAGIQYMDYGSFTRADEYGTITGEFKACDWALAVGYAYATKDSNITVGANIKIINSLIDTYSSLGIAVDFAALYRHSNERTLLTLVVRNLGTQLKSYDGTIEELPLQINFGVSSRLEHLPLKWYVNIENLQQWQLAVDNPSNQEIDIEGNIDPEDISFLNNAIRHLVIGAELFPDKKLTLRGGYNFRRSKELEINGTNTYGGFSYGVGLNLKKIKFNYSVTKFQPNVNSNTFSLVVNLF
ncbi:type IX secretion system protein PorQ [Flavicella sp.]|uniref:type IX secretion system protein PorQ n=1 Tax=Flavicella sp. TaxID=2957742 RepID=UPI003015E239